MTGASRGIGAEIARRLAAEGASVALVARSLEPGSGGHLAGSLRETADAISAAGGRALPIVADLADPACDRGGIVAQAERELGPVDILVNNAAACFYLSIEETSERRLRVAYEVNVITPYLLTKAVVPGMRDRKHGWVLNITSAIVDTDHLEGPQQARSSTYAPSKAAARPLDRVVRDGARGNRDRGERVGSRSRCCNPGRDRGDGLARGVVRAGRSDGGRRARVVHLRPRDGERHDRAFDPVPAIERHRGMTVALVTGGGSGIGQATARLLAARDVNVMVADINEDAARATADEIGGAAVAVDVADNDSVGAMVAACVARFGGLDWACNIAGIAPEPKPFLDHTVADWQRTIDVNLTGVFFCLQHELRQMTEQGRGGAIVNMSSGAGVVPAPGQPQYTAAKHGVLGLTKQAAQEFVRAGIRVNAVLPGQTETGPMRAYLDGMPDGGEKMLRRLPMGRMATTDEIAEAVVWLCSDAASYVNGVALTVDGGLILR